ARSRIRAASSRSSAVRAPTRKEQVVKVERLALMRAGVVAALVTGLGIPPSRADASSDSPSKARPSGASSPTIVEPSAFDWGDAGVGAAGALGLVFIAGGVLIVIRRDSPGRRPHG